MTRRYELTAIISDRMTADDLTQWQSTFADQVRGLEGAVLETHNLGRQTLGYRIKRRDVGYEQTATPIVVEFELPSNKLKEIDRLLKLELNVLRSMVTHASPPETRQPVTASPAAAVSSETPTPIAESAPVVEPIVSPAPPKAPEQPLSEAELDKRLDEILEAKEL